MRTALTLVAVVAALAAAPAAAQDTGGSVELYGPGQLGVVATTPSRLDRSRREMNRSRNARWNVTLTPSQARAEAEVAIRRAGFRCAVADALHVARTATGEPLIEVDCTQGGGLIIADGNPIQVVDCLDVAPGDPRIPACQLPANVASVAAERQSARN